MVIERKLTRFVTPNSGGQVVSGTKVASLEMIALGISDAGQWVVIGSVAFVCDGAAIPVPLLACLEDEPEKLFELLEYVEANRIAGNAVPRFPLIEMLDLGLRSKSAHWLPRVIRWIDKLIMRDDVRAFARDHKGYLLRFELPKSLKDALTE